MQNTLYAKNTSYAESQLKQTLMYLKINEKHPDINWNDIIYEFTDLFITQSSYHITFINFFTSVKYPSMHKLTLDQLLDKNPLFKYLFYSDIKSSQATNFLSSYLQIEPEYILELFDFVNVRKYYKNTRKSLISTKDFNKITDQYLLLSLAKFFCKIYYHMKFSLERHDVPVLGGLDNIITVFNRHKSSLHRKTLPQNVLNKIPSVYRKFTNYLWNKHCKYLYQFFCKSIDEIINELAIHPELLTIISEPLFKSSGTEIKSSLSSVKYSVLYKNNFYYFIYLLNQYNATPFDAEQLTVSLETIPPIGIQIEI